MADPGAHQAEYEHNGRGEYSSDHHPPVIVHLPADIAVLIALLYHNILLFFLCDLCDLCG